MLHINILCVGRLKEDYLKSAIFEYSKRLSKYCNLSIFEIEDEKIPSKINSAIIQGIKQKRSK